MKRKKLILIAFIFLLLVLLRFPSNVSAQPSKDVSYEKAVLNYDIGNGGSTEVQMEFTLVNESRRTSLQWTSRSIGSTELENLSVYTKSGEPLPHEEEVGEESTFVKVYFDGRMGPGENLVYYITFSAPDLASKDGPRYEARFGQLVLGSDDTPYEEYIVNVAGPPETELFLYKPEGITIIGENLHYETRLDPPTDFLGVKGTWFQSPVYYELTLTEQLKNPGEMETTDVSYDLLLFNREGAWQETGLSDSIPPLQALYKDEENNWRGVLETTSIKPNEQEEFKLSLIYEVHVHDPNITASEVGSLSEIPSRLETCLNPLEYWQSDHPTIQDAAETAVGNETNAYLVAKKITEFVTNLLDYQIQENRLGALTTYINEVGDCSEYTDLSIALARASGLPARASYGWGYHENKLIGHAWPEFYLPNVGWQPADPTWSDTEGRIRPGGLRTKFRVPPGLTGKLAPVLSGSSESYLTRLDTIHIQRNVRWLKSAESYGRYSYRGAKPEVSEGTNIEALSEEEAATAFLSAAQRNLNYASELLGENPQENMVSELNLAEDYLNQGKNVSNPKEKLELSQESLKHSYKILNLKAEKPESDDGGFEITDQVILLIIAAILAAGVALGLWYGIER